MTLLGSHLAVFLREYMPRDRRVSVHTCEAYAYAFELLVRFAAARFKTQPSALEIEQLDASLVLSFLEHLERERGNSARTRNARLAAIKAFFRFLEFRVPWSLDQARRIHAIPMKKTDSSLVDYLNRKEIQALLDSPDPCTRIGRRDRAMLHLAFAAGLRVSELIGVRLDEFHTHPHATIHIRGKLRRERSLPLWKETVAALQAWLSVRGENTRTEIFLNARGEPMSRSGFEYILAKHAKAGTEREPSLRSKRISPHVLRHSCAMHMLHATHDVHKVALWLGHAKLQSTEVYLHADPTEKMAALTAGMPPSLRPGRFRAPDKLLALLKSSEKAPNYAQ